MYGRYSSRRDGGAEESASFQRGQIIDYIVRIMLRLSSRIAILAAAAFVCARDPILAQGVPANPFPGGVNPDGSLRPSAPLARLFQLDAYTEYSILAPG